VRLLLIARPFVFHGGVERATAGLVGALVAHGVEVHLLSPPGQRPVPGVTLHRLPLPPLPSAARALALAAGARLVVARGAWDLVQSHERTLVQDVYRAGEGCHRAYLASRAGPPARGAYHRVVLALERRVFARTPAIVAIARRGAREIAELHGVGAARLSVVYNGVDLERFHPRQRAAWRAPAREAAGLPRGAFALLFVGSGFERKGLGTALEALAALDDRASRLVVVGKGETRPWRAAAERLGVGGRVTWLGPQPEPERWYAAADLVVLPSRYEPFGQVHLEALAAGVAVVASREAGGAELIEDGRNGAVVDPHDAHALAGAGERLRAAPADELSAAARRSAEPYTFARQVAGFAKVYRRLGAATPDFP